MGEKKRIDQFGSVQRTEEEGLETQINALLSVKMPACMQAEINY